LTNATHKFFDTTDTIDEMVDIIHGMCKTIELTEETQKVTNEPCDNACRTAATNEMIIMSYKTIKEMTKTFDRTNKMTADMNKPSNTMAKCTDTNEPSDDKMNKKTDEMKNRRAETIDYTTDKTKHDIMLTINADEASVKTNKEATNGKSCYDSTSNSGINDEDNNNDGVDDRDTDGRSYKDAHNCGINNNDDDDRTEATVNHTVLIDKNEETCDDKGHYGNANDDGMDNNPKKETTNNGDDG